MIGNGWKQQEWLEMAEIGWKWLKISVNGCNGQKGLEMAGASWKWLDENGMAGNGWKWPKLA